MNKALLAVLLLAAFNANATKNNEGCQGNCPSTGGGSNEANNHANSSSDSSSSAGAVGVGVGVGLGGDGGNATAAATGGAGGGGGNGYGGNAVGLGGSGGHSSSAVKDSGNSFNVNTTKGGSAHQGQSQGQSLNSANLLRMTSENTNKVNASSANDNRSSATGNTTVTNVGGDSTLVERNAPPVFLGNLSATMSCSGGFNAGASDRNGSGAFGFTWISGDCRSVVIGREFLSIGMADVSCRIWKTTKGYKRAVKADPSLADVDCTAKPAPAPVLVAPELAPRVPRG